MGVFKKSFRDYKNSLKKRKKLKINKMRTILITVFCTTLVVIMFSFISLRFLNKDSQRSITYTSINNSTKNTQNINLNNESAKLYINQYKSTFEYWNSNLFKSNDASHTKDLYNFTLKFDGLLLNNAKTIYKLAKEIPSLYNQQKDDKDLNTLYYSRQIIIIKMLEISYNTYDWYNKHKKIYKIEILNNIKFIHQELILHKVNNVKIAMRKTFEDLMVDNLNKYLEKSDKVKNCIKKVFKLFEYLHKNLFTKFSGTIFTDEYGHKPKLDTLLKDFEVYREYFELNYYLVFIDIFNVNEECEVVEFKTEFKGLLNEKDYNYIVDSCKLVFVELVKYEKEKGYDYKEFNKCRDGLERLNSK